MHEENDKVMADFGRDVWEWLKIKWEDLGHDTLEELVEFAEIHGIAEQFYIEPKVCIALGFIESEKVFHFGKNQPLRSLRKVKNA